MQHRLSKADWIVKDVPQCVALEVIQRNHYSGGAAKQSAALHGLFHVDDPATCKGAAWWMPPTRSSALSVSQENPNGVLALSRLAIDPDVPKNGATFLLSKSRKLLDRDRWPALVTYADTWQGHTGAIYRADNWEYVGETRAYPVYVLDGKTVSPRRGQRTLNHQQLLAEGAVCQGRFTKHKFVHLDRRKPRTAFV